MAVERAGAGSSLIDVLDRVLDKGIVIDAYVRVSLVGIDLVSVEARIVVASVETYLKFAEAIGITGFASRPMMGSGTNVGSTEMDRVMTENADMKRLMAENAELRRRLDEKT
jgi:hypothetical protein